jgi:microcin C transport system permease protein
MTLSPVTRRRLANFQANRRGWWSFWLFTALFLVTLFAEFIANDRPLLVHVDDRWLVPVLVSSKHFH